MNPSFLVSAFFVLILACHAAPSNAAKSEQRKSEVRDLVNLLSDQSNEVRAKAAQALRPILAADPAIAPNWHDKEYWTQQIEKTKPEMSLDDALRLLLPDLSADELKKRNLGGAWSGGSGVEMFQLDDYWQASFQLKDIDKRLLIERPKLDPHVRPIWVEPPKHFTGLWTTWCANGQKANEVQYIDGKRDGTFTAFYDNGEKAYVQHAKQDISDGPDTGWFRSGKKMYEGQHNNNRQDGTWRHWYESGQLASEYTYKNGKNDGPRISWFENGQKRYEEYYKNGKKEGREAYWDEQGKLISDKKYHNDEFVEPRR